MVTKELLIELGNKVSISRGERLERLFIAPFIDLNFRMIGLCDFLITHSFYGFALDMIYPDTEDDFKK